MFEDSGSVTQVALRENKIISKKSPDVLLYQSDTAPGSSGSPVFNDQWQVGTPQPQKTAAVHCELAVEHSVMKSTGMWLAF